MLVVHVHVRVLPESIDAFIAASQANARESRKEPGVVRFDLLQVEGAPDRFLLVEIYRDADAPARHKETAHYATWRDTVAPMMAEPRTATKLRATSEEDVARWAYPS